MREAPFALLISGSGGQAGEHDSGVETYDPEDLMPMGDGVYRTTFRWPEHWELGVSQYSPMGIHGGRLPVRHWGGEFQTLRIERERQTAQVAIVKYAGLGEAPESRRPVGALYLGHCRIVEGDEARSIFRTLDE